MLTKKQIRESAYDLVQDYVKHGLDHVAEICERGVNVEIVKYAAHLLQSDEQFASWAFIFVMTAHAVKVND